LKENIISPYSIDNQTDFILIVRRLDENGRPFINNPLKEQKTKI